MNTNLTTEEAERLWYCLGWPAPQRPEDLDDALECHSWRDVAETHNIACPSDLDDHLTNVKHAQAMREGLDALADWLDGLPLGDVISDFMFAPGCEDLAVGLERIDRPGWCPMMTAPMDGTAVDLWVNGERKAECYFIQESWRDWQGGEVGTPTHWMAIPTGPAA